jgi:GNAT superfamily N-acetyltransferase
VKEPEENIENKVVIRLIEERDVKGVLEVLSTEQFYRKADGFPQDFEQALIRKAKKVREGGFDKYSNTLVAATKDKAVARLIMDNNYPPYSELAGLLVHPDYRGMGIGTKLVREFMNLTQKHGCNILYAISDKNDIRTHMFYTRLGFKPAILSCFAKDEEEIVLFQFLKGTSQHEFVHNHPLTGFSVSESMVDFHGQSLYEMKWKDSLTGSYIAYYLKGRRHITMPRITGISLKESNIALDVWITEETTEVDFEHEGKFRIFMANRFSETLTANVDYILPERTTLKGANTLEEVTLKGVSETNRELCLKLEMGCNVPPLSFRTVLATCSIKLYRLRSPLFVSAGFERNR